MNYKKRNMFKNYSYPFRLALILTIKAICLLLVILYAGIGLGPDEAQYWTWSQELDWGYYSKPPAIAWQIWLGTQLFGSTEIGVRVLSLFLAVVQSFTVYYLALASGLQARTAFWSAILMAFCPIGLFGSLFAITDGGFLLFWTLAAICVASALHKKQAPNPFLVGFCILGGALFKWPIYSFWIFYFLLYPIYFRSQSIYKSIGGVLVSLLGLLPSIWWNWSHDWVTFKHVVSTLQGGHGSSSGNVLEFLGSQALLLSPILFVLLVIAYFQKVRSFRQLSAPLVFCGLTSLVIFLIVFSASFFQKIQGNWALAIYPTAIVILGWYCCEQSSKAFRWMQCGTVLSVVMAVLVIWIKPFKHNLGWTELNSTLIEQGYDSDKNFLVSDKYQTSSILSFYSPGQKRAYFLNLEGHRQNQFSYWPLLQEQERGKIGFFVWIENAPHLQKNWETKQKNYQLELQKYFEKVEFLGLFPLIHGEDQLEKAALFFRCTHCLDAKPEELSLY